MTDAPRPSQLRSRLTLLLIVSMFFASFLVAAGLRFAGWTPESARNYGELLQPPVHLGQVPLHRADGSLFAWQPESDRWSLVVAPAPGCTTACTRTLDQLHRIWLSLGRKADRLDVLWVGPLPEGQRFRRLVPMQPSAELSRALPGTAASAEGVVVYLVDPKGYVALRYPAGFDPAGLRKDLGKLIR